MGRIIDRLDKYMEYKGINANQITINCSLAVGLINQARKGRSDIGKKSIEKILNYYQDLNSVWLITGVGSMIKDQDPPDYVPKTYPIQANKEEETEEHHTTKLLPMSCIGGTLSGIVADGATMYDCETIISPIKGADFAITVYGDSMYPDYPSGAKVLIKKINHNIFIEWGNTYVLDTCNGVIIKQVHKCDKEGYITCHSINPEPRFADFDIPLSEVYGMYRILMCMYVR
jgi:phage repressor protein C with HTH and peptisase S24 domain